MTADWRDDVDLRAEPWRYEVGRGEQGVFHWQPYKAELLPLWTVRTLDEARESVTAIRDRYESYLADDDFPGADMARKYLQMGRTRALRYARYPGGTKHEPDGTPREPVEWVDEEKAAIASAYGEALDDVRADDRYREARDRWRARTEDRTDT